MIRLLGIHGKALSGKDILANILVKTYGFKKIAFADRIKHFCHVYFEVPKEHLYEKKTKQSRAILQGLGECTRKELNKIANELIPLEMGQVPSMGVSGFPKWIENYGIKYFSVEPSDLTTRKIYPRIILSGINNFFSSNIEELLEISNSDSSDVWVNYLKKDIQDELTFRNQDQVYVVSDVRYKNEKEFILQNNGKVIKIIRTDRPKIETGYNHSSEIDLDSDFDFYYTIMNRKKSNWQNEMEQAALNIVKKLLHDGFLTEEDKKGFMINV